MNLPTRWIKVLRDIQKNKTRSILVVLSIAVGVFAIGMTSNAGLIIQRDMYEPFQASNPHSTLLYLAPFNEDLAGIIESRPEIAQAEVRRVEMAKIQRHGGTWSDIELSVAPDYGRGVRIDRFTIEAGQSTPQAGQILLERMTAKLLRISIGDRLQVKLPGRDDVHSLIVAGIVHDMHKLPPQWLDVGAGYLSMDTLVGMGAEQGYNVVSLVVAEESTDKQHILQVARLVRDEVLEPAGYRVVRIQPFVSEPGKPWAYEFIPAVLMVLMVMGGMCILLGVGLVINTISALITQQVKQIGILRAVGGLRRQILLMYLSGVLILCIAALVIAIPFGLLGAKFMAGMVGEELNFTVTRVNLPLSVALLQIAIGLFVPLGAAVVPILSGTSISVYRAIYQQGNIPAVQQGTLARLLNKIRGLSSPAILAARNTFRRKVRLAFTLATLALSGATFMAAFSARLSMQNEIVGMGRYWQIDVAMEMTESAERQVVEREARSATGAGLAEGWYRAMVTIVSSDGNESEEMELMAVPPETLTIEPRLLAGRWLQAGDAQAVVVNEEFLKKVPGIQVGDALILWVGGLQDQAEHRYTVVGIVSRHLTGPRLYASNDSFTGQIGAAGQANLVRVRLDPDQLQSGDEQARLGAQLQAHFQSVGLSSGGTDTQYDAVVANKSNFDILLGVLVFMAGLLALVGGMGLAGTMSLNVLERTREIGVLRAVGASNAAVRKIVLFEGVVVGLLGWALSAVISLPFGYLLTQVVSRAMFGAGVVYYIDPTGIWLWVVLVQAIAALSSLAPAQHAARLTVREVLAYE